MRQKLSRPPTRSVTISRPEGEVSYTLSALPLGYSQYLESVYPAPTMVLNGEPVPDNAKMGLWRLDVNCLCLAKALGDEMESTAPTTGGRDAWATHARSVRDEFDAAGLTDGELGDLATALGGVIRGTAALGKA